MIDTNEVSEENVKTLVKLGIDVQDLAKIYVQITEKGHDISKGEYIDNLTNMFKFFQTRNKGLEENEELVLKEDVLEMIQKNKKIVCLDLDKKIKFVCNKLDSYYFMLPSYTNKLIKSNPKIFNVNKIDLEIFSGILSVFAIKIDGEIVNLYEYIIKHKSEILNLDVQNVFHRLMYIKNEKKSKLIDLKDLEIIEKYKFQYNEKEITDKELKEIYLLPKYNLEDINIYKEKVLKIMGE